MLFTGQDKQKKVSIDYNFLKKDWKLTDKEGRKIIVIPSHKVLIKTENIPEGIKKPSELRKTLLLRFSKYLFDFNASFKERKYTFVLVRDFHFPKDFFALDPEPFALARLSNILGLKNLYILDIGEYKTTFVEVENFSLKSYRVILRGGKYLTDLIAKKLNLSFDEAEKLKIEKGLNLQPLKEAIGEILREIPLKEENIPLLLSGGGSRLKGLSSYFKNPIVPDAKIPVPREKYSALGAALKFVYRDNSPAFRKEEITKKEVKIFAFLFLSTFLAFFLTLEYLQNIEENFRLQIIKKEQELFQNKFPNLPPVAMLEQLETFNTQKPKFIDPLFEKLIRTLPRQVKIYKIFYQNGVLKVEGESPPQVINQIKATSWKRLDNGNYLIEVRIK